MKKFEKRLQIYLKQILSPYNNTQEFQQMLRQRDAKFWGHYFLKHINVDLDKNVKAKLSIPKEGEVVFTDGKILKQEIDKVLHLVDAALKEPGLESNYVKHLMQDKRVLMGLVKTVEEMPSYQNETPKKVDMDPHNYPLDFDKENWRKVIEFSKKCFNPE